MKILFLGSLCPPILYDKCISTNIQLDNAALALQKSILKGLHKKCELVTISLPHLFTNNLFFKGYKYADNNSNTNISVPFCNLSGLKQILTPYITQFYINKSCFDVVFIYAVQSHWLKVAYKIKKNNPNVKIVIMVPDLPQFMSERNGKIYLMLKSIESSVVSRYIKCVDGFIFLSKYMKDCFPLKKPYIVVEGICGDDHIAFKKRKINNMKKILYTGTLDIRYGIKNLIEAFLSVPNENYELLICGKGNGERLISKSIEKDSRIKYLGQLNRNEILKLQKNADLLINPRGADGIYTKYSFPSKTIEYMVSGTPVLLCKLPAIPCEYYDYCFTIENNDSDIIASKIKEILNMSPDYLVEFGLQAQRFVLTNKNCFVQGSRIINFINSL